jgi:hypothetical protein
MSVPLSRAPVSMPVSTAPVSTGGTSHVSVCEFAHAETAMTIEARAAVRMFDERVTIADDLRSFARWQVCGWRDQPAEPASKGGPASNGGSASAGDPASNGGPASIGGMTSGGRPASGRLASGRLESGGGGAMSGGGPESKGGIPESNGTPPSVPPPGHNVGGSGRQRLKTQQPPPEHPAQSALVVHIVGHSPGPESCTIIIGHIGIGYVAHRPDMQHIELVGATGGHATWHS